jgi:hypothetical protein
VTKPELIERAKRRLNAGQPQPHTWVESEIELAACVNDALHELSASVMRDSMRRSWLQQNYTVNLDANGESTDLLTAVGSITGEVGEIILEGIHFGLVRDADNNVLKPLFHYLDFVSPQAVVYPYYLQKNNGMATRALGAQVNGPADIVGVSSPLTITANYTPKNVNDIPLALEDDAVAHLCEVVTRKLPANATA